jgi:glycine/D-amino acid oxidase-like deaminating enzyme
MGPYVDSVTSDEAIPATTSVVVIGGGIIGTFAALTLAGRGIPVVLCEKGYVACEQSSRNWGWCGPRRARNAVDCAKSGAVARHEPFDGS